MIKSNYAAFVFIFLLSTGILQAQRPDPGLPEEENEVIRKFEARLADSEKKNTSPLLPQIETNLPSLQYSLPTELFGSSYDAPKIRPLAIKKGQAEEDFHFWARLGIGYPLSPFAHVKYNQSSEKLFFGADLKHHSQTGPLDNQKFQESRVGFNADYFTEKIRFGAHAGYGFDKYHFYGYDFSDTTLMEDPFHRFGHFNGGVNAGSVIKNDGDFSWDSKLDLHTFSTNFDKKEFQIIASVGLNKWIAQKHLLRLEVIEDFHNTKNNPATNKSNLIAVRPSFTFHHQKFRIKLGAEVDFEEKVYAYPDVEFLVNLAGSEVIFYAGWNGGVRKNTLRSLNQYNHWLDQNQSLPPNSRVEYRYGGLKGEVGRFSYDFQGGHHPVKNMLYFTNWISPIKKFLVQYTDASNVLVKGGLGYQIPEKFDLNLNATYNIYNFDAPGDAYHLPELDLELGAKYYIGKFVFGTDMHFLAGISTVDEFSDENLLPLIADINLSGQYKIQKNITAFIDLNNITASKYQRWNEYPVVGFNVLGGIMLKF